MKKTTVNLTFAAIIVCLLLLTAFCFAAPFVTKIYANIRFLSEVSRKAILWAFYLSVIPAAASLGCLLKLLINIRRDQPFLKENSELMAVISVFCLAEAAICGVTGIWYMPLWFITPAMLFLFLIVRVVRGCFDAAICLKEENSLTI